MESNKMPLHITIGLVIGAVLGVVVGMNFTSSPSKVSAINLSGESQEGSCGLSDTAPKGYMTMNGKVFHKTDFPTTTQDALYNVEQENYTKLTRTLEEFAVRYNLALEKDSNVNINKLPETMKLLAKKTVSDKELKEFFESNKKRLPPNSKFEEMKPQLTQYLQMQGAQKSFQEALKKLKDSKKYRILTKEPIPPKVSINFEGFPTLGPKDAKNVLVEASDYMCGHCKHVHPEVKAMLKKLDGKIRFVQMNFALRPAGTSGKMIQGAFCARKESESKFWEYHNKAFDYKGKEEPNPVAIAKSAGVSMVNFEKCLDSAEAKDHVAKTNGILQGIGVSGTPTFFLNNRKIKISEGNLVKTIEENMI